MEKDNKQDKAIAILENNYSHMTKQLEEIKSGINDIKSEITCIRKETAQAFTDHIKESDERYASKLSEKIVYTLVGVLSMSVIVAIVGLVITK